MSWRYMETSSTRSVSAESKGGGESLEVEAMLVGTPRCYVDLEMRIDARTKSLERDSSLGRIEAASIQVVS